MAGAPSIAPPLSFTADAPRAPIATEAWPGANGGVFAYCGAAGERYSMSLPGLATLEFGGDGPVMASPCVGADEPAVAEAYWRDALPLVLHARGWEVLHASAVETSRGVVAFCGDSGAGKSTIAYALHRRGFPLWADDAVALDVTSPAIVARRLPFEVRLRPASAARFDLGARAVRLADPAASRAAASPLAGLCLLERGSVASLRALAASAAYPRALAQAFCFQLGDPARKRLMLERYLALVARVPVFALAVPDGLDRLDETCDLVIAALDREEPSAR